MAKKVSGTPRIRIRELFNADPIELLHGLKTRLSVIWEDGVETEMSSKEVIVNKYALEILKGLPEVPLVSKYHINKYYTNGIYVSKTINKLYEAVVNDVVDLYVKPTNDRSILETLYKNMYNVVNDMYNNIIYAIPEYCVNLDILDFLEIQTNERLLESIKAVKYDNRPETISASYNVLDDILRNDPSLAKNRLSKGYISNTLNPNQLKQILAPRGYGTEINSELFKTPIYSSFCIGLYNMYHMAVESRSAAKALYLSTKAIQTSEYFARELQLVTMNIEHLVDGDCGSTDYMDWYVRPAEDGNKADLPNLIGKFFLNDKGELEEITAKHKHLEGTTIKLRSAMNCKLQESNCICSKCFGTLSYGMFKHTNLGHISATSLTQKISQSILSTKHLVSSATTNDIVLDENAKLFFNVVNKNNYGFKKEVLTGKTASMRMIVTQYEAYGIKDLNANVDTSKLYPSKISRIESIILEVSQNGTTAEYPIVVRNGNKRGSFTLPFLAYILQGHYTLDEQDRYVIDLSKWKSTGPVITLPQIEFNFLELVKRIKSEFKSMKYIKDKRSAETKESLLQKVFDLVNIKLDVNIALLEVIVYAFTVKSLENKDFRLGRNTEDSQLAKIKDLMKNKSLGGSFAWEHVIKILLSPTSFNGYNNIDHIMDIMVRPKEVLEDKGIKTTLH